MIHVLRLKLSTDVLLRAHMNHRVMRVKIELRSTMIYTRLGTWMGIYRCTVKRNQK